MSKKINKKRGPNYWKYSTIAIIIVIGVIVTMNLTSKNEIQSGPIDDDAILGDNNAPITLVEFGDYQCPFCVKFWQETLPQIKENYIDTGKVKFVYRDYPIPGHPGAMPAALAAECVREQGGDSEYYRMHDGIFANAAYDSDSLKIIASTLGYEIDECLDSEKFALEIQKDMADGQALGIRGTPVFILNGKLISGAQPYEVFRQAIEAEL